MVVLAGMGRITELICNRGGRPFTHFAAGAGGIGSSIALSPGPAASGLKRPFIAPAEERRERTLNAFYEDVLTYGEEREYRDLRS